MKVPDLNTHSHLYPNSPRRIQKNNGPQNVCKAEDTVCSMSIANFF